MFENQWAYLGFIVTIVGSVWSLAWWLSGQFSHIRSNMYSAIKEVEKTILEKLEYHERHDDTRFSQIRDDIWNIRVLNAADNKLKKE